MYCNVTAVLKADSLYKQSKNYHAQVYVEECKCTDVESQNVACRDVHMIMRILWCVRRHEKKM